MSTGHNPRGSIWRRWDPHLHAPGTLLNDQFGGGWETYLSRIEKSDPKIEALGVTDYFCIDTYKEVRKQKASGRLPQVQLLFPNVELRIDIKTAEARAINIHLLFSPADPNHEAEIERILAQLKFEYREREYLLHAFRPCRPRQGPRPQADRRARRAENRGEPVQDLAARPQGAFQTSDGCERTASSPSPASRAMAPPASKTTMRLPRCGRSWNASLTSCSAAGRRTASSGWLKTGRQQAVHRRSLPALKPCLHGSDAHCDDETGAPDLERYCWLKGDLTFETLRQAVIEPGDRVSDRRSAALVCSSSGNNRRRRNRQRALDEK